MKTIVPFFFFIFLFLLNESLAAQNTPVKKSKADSAATYEAFITQSKANIKKNEASIDALKAKRDQRLADIKTKYDNQIATLESKNKAIRKKVKSASPNNWRQLQASMNSDMQSFENFLLEHAADDE